MRRLLTSLLALSFLAAFPLHGFAHPGEGPAQACPASLAAKSVHAAPDAPALVCEPLAASDVAVPSVGLAAPSASVLPPSRAPPR